MVNYEQDVITITDGNLISLANGDIIVGIFDDSGTDKLLILRIIRTSSRG